MSLSLYLKVRVWLRAQWDRVFIERYGLVGASSRGGEGGSRRGYVGRRRDPNSWTAPTREVPAVGGRRFRAEVPQ